MPFPRRALLTGGAALAGYQALQAHAPARLIGQTPPLEQAPFLFAVVSDTHVIDQFYKPGSENGTEDNDSILHANERFRSARETIRAIRLADGRQVERVFIPGDCFHNYPSTDYDFYQANQTRIDIFKQTVDGFNVPVHLGFGNHDYGVPQVSREMSHRLFHEKLNTEPYSAVDDRGFRFLHLNNFLGSTWDAASKDYNRGRGSLGRNPTAVGRGATESTQADSCLCALSLGVGAADRVRRLRAVPASSQVPGHGAHRHQRPLAQVDGFCTQLWTAAYGGGGNAVRSAQLDAVGGEPADRAGALAGPQAGGVVDALCAAV